MDTSDTNYILLQLKSIINVFSSADYISWEWDG